MKQYYYSADTGCPELSNQLLGPISQNDLEALRVHFNETHNIRYFKKNWGQWIELYAKKIVIFQKVDQLS
jgi:ribosomal protein L16/L10AE